jgi:hypothetical protein
LFCFYQLICCFESVEEILLPKTLNVEDNYISIRVCSAVFSVRTFQCTLHNTPKCNDCVKNTVGARCIFFFAPCTLKCAHFHCVKKNTLWCMCSFTQKKSVFFFFCTVYFSVFFFAKKYKNLK